MPTYEYVCRDCGEHIEVVQSFREEALTDCGLCGGTLRKVFSAAGIIFKGDGYYVTDSRKQDRRKAAAKEGAKTGSGSGSADSATGSSGSGSSDAGSGSSDSGSGSSSVAESA